MAADSRYSNGDGFCDFGIKVLELPLRIRSASDSVTGVSTILHEATFGMTFSGAVLPGFLVKERVAEVLYNLQYIGANEDMTFARLAELCSTVYWRVCESLGEAFLSDTEVLLVGACPLSGDANAIKLSLNEGGPNSFLPISVDTNAEFEAIGSHTDEFRMLVEDEMQNRKCLDSAILLSLRRMSRNNAFKTIGGAIQYGEQNSHRNFEVRGVIDYELEGTRLRTIAPVRGIDIEELQPVGKDAGMQSLFVSAKFIDPFRDEAEKLAQLSQGCASLEN